MEDQEQQLSLKWKPSNYFIVGGVLFCIGLIVFVMAKYLTAYLIFLAGITLLLWPISRLLGQNQKIGKALSVIVFLACAGYFSWIQADTFPIWKTILLVIWSILLLLAYLSSFRRAPVQKI